MASCGTASLIDLVLMFNPSLLQQCSAVPSPSNLDHNGVGLSGAEKCYSYVLFKINLKNIILMKLGKFYGNHFPKGVLP